MSLVGITKNMRYQMGFNDDIQNQIPWFSSIPENFPGMFTRNNFDYYAIKMFSKDEPCVNMHEFVHEKHPRHILTIVC